MLSLSETTKKTHPLTKRRINVQINEIAIGGEDCSGVCVSNGKKYEIRISRLWREDMSQMKDERE